MTKAFVGWYSILIGAVGCSGSTSTVCTDEFRPGIAVYVNDSLTNAGIASGASLVVRDGSYKDSVAAPDGRPDLNTSPLYAAGERAGIYQVAVTKTGYAGWAKSDVRVTANRCHVNTVTLTALLQPAS
ncbi:MAG: hypothetical protein ACRENK_08790 [Gemmatimonadaceae bacterium]